MNWKKSLRAAGLVAILSLGACNGESTYSPQEIIDQALQEKKEIESYYGEYTMDMGEKAGTAMVKEWMKDGKRRIEMTGDNGQIVMTVYDSEQVMAYDVAENTVHKITLPKEQLDEIAGQSPSEQAKFLLDFVKDTHDMNIAGEEKIAGRDAYHIVAKAKKADTLFGDLEIWIDKKTWVTLKMTTITAGNKMTTEYTKIDINSKVDDAKFTLDIPTDATIEEMDGENASSEIVPLDRVKEKLGEFLMVPEADGLQLVMIEDMKVEERSEFAFTYVIDELPAFSVSVFKMVNHYKTFGGVPSEKEIEVRGQKGTLTEQGNFRSISWQEDGYQYSVLLENSEMTVEDVYTYVDKMTVVQ